MHNSISAYVMCPEYHLNLLGVVYVKMHDKENELRRENQMVFYSGGYLRFYVVHGLHFVLYRCIQRFGVANSWVDDLCTSKILSKYI